MALWRGIGARKDATRGTSPIEVRKVLAGLFASVGGIGARSGILYNGSTAALVTGDATYAYNVGLFHAFVSRSASDGGQVYGNDGAVLIGATGVGSTVPIAPGAGLQRIDIMWTRHPANLENADTSSEPLFGVASGVAVSANPVAPSIPAGALGIGRNLMTSAATSTLSAGNTITQSALFTALRGAPVPCRNQAEQDALIAFDGALADRLDTHTVWRSNGTAWFPVSGAMPGGRVVRDGTAFTIPATTWQPLSSYLTVVDQPALGIAPISGGVWTITTPGVYDVEAGFHSTTPSVNVELIVKLNDITASTTGTRLTGSVQTGPLGGAASVKGRLRLNAGDTLMLAVYASAAANWTNSTSNYEAAGNFFGLRFVEPLR